MDDNMYGAVVLHIGVPKSAYFECDICECKFKVRINAENQYENSSDPVLGVHRRSIKADGMLYSMAVFNAKCPCCGSEVETTNTITEVEDV